MAHYAGNGSPGGCVTRSVFISYRREDCPGHAGRLFDHLRSRFGTASVFMDVTDIEAGVDFVDVLERAVGSCDVLLAVIGREWLTCSDRSGRRRLEDPHDFVRLEIGTALTRNVRVIPVLVEGAVMPTASDLPSDIEGLTRRQAVELRDARWNADVDSLAGVLDRVLGPRAAVNGSSPSEPGHTKWLWGLAAVALIGALVAVVTLVPRGGSTPTAPASQAVSGTVADAGQRSVVQAETPPASEQAARRQTPPPPQPAPASASPSRTAAVGSVPSGSQPPPTPVSAGWLGVQLVNGDASSNGEGIGGAVVRSLTRGGPASNAGLLAGDLIIAYGGAPISDVDTLVRLAAANPPRRLGPDPHPSWEHGADDRGGRR